MAKDIINSGLLDAAPSDAPAPQEKEKKKRGRPPKAANKTGDGKTESGDAGFGKPGTANATARPKGNENQDTAAATVRPDGENKPVATEATGRAKSEGSETVKKQPARRGRKPAATAKGQGDAGSVKSDSSDNKADTAGATPRPKANSGEKKAADSASKNAESGEPAKKQPARRGRKPASDKMSDTAESTTSVDGSGKSGAAEVISRPKENEQPDTANATVRPDGESKPDTTTAEAATKPRRRSRGGKKKDTTAPAVNATTATENTATDLIKSGAANATTRTDTDGKPASDGDAGRPGTTGATASHDGETATEHTDKPAAKKRRHKKKPAAQTADGTQAATSSPAPEQAEKPDDKQADRDRKPAERKDEQGQKPCQDGQQKQPQQEKSGNAEKGAGKNGEQRRDGKKKKQNGNGRGNGHPHRLPPIIDDKTNKELIINVASNEITIALLEDKQLVELNKEKGKTGFAVGDIYLGRVRKIMPGLNAAFVNIGYEKDAFIHYLDLGPQFATFHKMTGAITSDKKLPEFEKLKVEPAINKKGKMSTYLSSGQPIIVQIAKEAISTKGPRLTSEISLAGRHVVLMPFGGKISISQKIRDNGEKRRLKKIAESVLPKNYGIIIRTAAVGKSDADIANDITSLVSRWETAMTKMRGQEPPQLLLSEMNRATSIIRDLLNGSFSSIVVDDKSLYEEILEYIKNIAPEKEKIVKLYKGRTPIFDNYDISKQIQSLFSKYVSLRKGAYLIIEHTEAMHVVDVNSGNRAKVEDDQERTAMEVNLTAAAELARQLRLRDMGGIIVVDFIDLHKGDNRQALLDKMTEVMASDRAKHTILPLSKFGLMQITRQRVRPEAIQEVTEACPTCGGTGKIATTIDLDQQIENQLAYFALDKGIKALSLRVSPYVAAFLEKGLFTSKRKKWAKKYNVKLDVVSDPSIGFIEAKFFDGQGNQLD